jgi:hypothetical protein
MALFIVPVCTAASLVVWRYDQLGGDVHREDGRRSLQ